MFLGEKERLGVGVGESSCKMDGETVQEEPGKVRRGDVGHRLEQGEEEAWRHGEQEGSVHRVFTRQEKGVSKR